MTVDVGMVTVVRFPEDQIPTPAVAKVYAVRGGQVLVAKHLGRGGLRRWAKRRWVPLVDVARAATEREVTTGHVIDPLPPRAAA